LSTIVEDEATLRSLYPQQVELRRKTILDRLDRHCRNFIAHSPFLVLATAGADGGVDASPRGDAPGFVQVLDDRTLAIPDRRGNNRLDSMSNISARPQVGLLFFIPGIGETLRVNGRARITTDPELTVRMAVQHKAPAAAILVEVEQAYLHCGKALIRSHLWDDTYRLDRHAFPSLGRMMADQAGDGSDAAATEAQIEEAYRERLY
jgi:PPOX class probable FMN-dependent enzyme